MAESKYNRNPLKILESVGKEVIAGVLSDLVEKDALKLEESDRKKFEEAKSGEKAWVVVDAIRQKRHNLGDALQALLNISKNSIEKEVSPKSKAGTPESLESVDALQPPESVTGPPESLESTDVLRLCPREEFLRISKERAGEIYPIKESKDRTRLALVICNAEFDQLQFRHGAEHDIRGMQELLESLGYEVDVKQQLTAKAMEDALRQFAARPEHRSSDSTFLVFMSHGNLEGICGTAHSEEKPDILPSDTIFQIVNTRNCPFLKDKPKVVLVQTCRGVKPGVALVSDSPTASAACFTPENLEDDAICKTHVEKDFIAFYSSTPHTKSWRDPMRGSYFIIELIKCLQKYAWCCHLLEIFQKVQQSFEKRSDAFQMPTIERLNMPKYFYLFPGN